MNKVKNNDCLNERQIDRVVEMAWEDRTPFDAIKLQFGLIEKDVIDLLRRDLKLSSFKMWRSRVKGRLTKHAKIRNDDVERFKSSQQRQITLNKISKRR